MAWSKEMIIFAVLLLFAVLFAIAAGSILQGMGPSVKIPGRTIIDSVANWVKSII